MSSPEITPMPESEARLHHIRHTKPKFFQSRRVRENLLGILLVSPTLLVIGTIVVQPLLRNLWQSFL